VMQVLWRD